ncbi:hypothetical protein DVH24_001934 [Malus domestica]|uniref:Uncharacterized protein n=1 Tax=Malus domestica TaxID=3750 RepID=A0A498I4I1_MALDO|nr:hypothetical protein DVH24_001934 [Malus domestica]
MSAMWRRGAGCFSLPTAMWRRAGLSSGLNIRKLSTPRSGGGKNPKATPSSAPHPTRATVSSPSSPTLPQNPACFTGRRRRDGCSKDLKSMVAAGLATIACCNYNLMDAVSGTENMRILFIGQDGGSLPLFLASKMQGAVVDVVEIDPLVISAAVRAMGFPAFSIMTPSGKHAVSPNTMDKASTRGCSSMNPVLRISFSILNTTNQYDMPSAAGFTRDHGTVVVNLHSDSDILDPDGSAPSVLQQTLPMGKYVLRVYRAYKNVVVGGKDSGLGFTVSVPWVCNSSLVVCRGFRVKGGDSNSDVIMDALISKCFELENVLNLPFSCFEYIKRAQGNQRMASEGRKRLSLRSNGEEQSMLSRVSQSEIVQQTKRMAIDASSVTKKLAKSTGKAAWILGTTFLILGVPLIIAMDREQQFNELELQQASILGSPPPPPAFN